MSLSKRIRFEVFKRDKFTCQYCGKKAPDVVLQCDHIDPKAGGGSDDLLNLITSCVECNSGKSDKRLADDSAMVARRTQLELLQERREQLEMMIEWQRALTDIGSQELDEVAALWNSFIEPMRVNEIGRKSLRTWLRKYGFGEVCTAIRISADQYLVVDAEGNVDDDSAQLAFRKIGGICSVRLAQADKPYLADLFYVRGIVRNTVSYFRPDDAKRLLEKAYQLGGETEELKRVARSAHNWSRWLDDMEEYIAALREDAPNA